MFFKLTKLHFQYMSSSAKRSSFRMTVSKYEVKKTVRIQNGRLTDSDSKMVLIIAVIPPYCLAEPCKRVKGNVYIHHNLLIFVYFLFHNPPINPFWERSSFLRTIYSPIEWKLDFVRKLCHFWGVERGNWTVHKLCNTLSEISSTLSQIELFYNTIYSFLCTNTCKFGNKEIWEMEERKFPIELVTSLVFVETPLSWHRYGRIFQFYFVSIISNT